MAANAVITHVSNQGVTLRKAGDPAPAPHATNPFRTVNVAPHMGGSWWGVPAHVVSGWITQRLRKGQYAHAASLSACLHR